MKNNYHYPKPFVNSSRITLSQAFIFSICGLDMISEFQNLQQNKRTHLLKLCDIFISVENLWEKGKWMW